MKLIKKIAFVGCLTASIIGLGASRIRADSSNVEFNENLDFIQLDPNPEMAFSGFAIEQKAVIGFDVSHDFFLVADPLIQRFLAALQRLEIPVRYETCKAGLAGSYNYARNEVTLCPNNLRGDRGAYVTTLAHESWHVIQDHATGLDNVVIAPISQSASDYGSFAAMAAGLDANRMQTILNRYETEDYAFETEAFMMEAYPETVLEILENIHLP